MPKTRALLVPVWKQAVAVACAAYILLAWIVPIFIAPFVNVLPFVHERRLLDRFFISAIGSTAMIVVLIAINPQRIKTLQIIEPDWSRSRKWNQRVLAMLGLVMFTYAAAELSPNSLGLLAHIFPSEPYSERVVLESVTFYGSRNKSVSLEFKDPHHGTLQYLVLSKRIFTYPRFVPGEVLELQGKSGPIGVYITDFRLIERGSDMPIGLTPHSTGPARKAAQAG